MLGVLFVILCLVAPVLLMWRVLAVQRRVRAMTRRPDGDAPYVAPYTDVVASADGLTCARTFDVNDELLAATRKSNEPSDIKNLQGQR